MSNKNKVLLIGSSFSAISLLIYIKKLGYSVSVCGALKDDPCHLYADESFYIDYSKKDELLKLCKNNHFDFIVPTCNDFSYNSASYVATELGLYFGFDNYQTTMLLHTKDSFKEFTQKNKFNVSKTYTSEEVLGDNGDIKYPLLIKPVDSFSGKGVTKIGIKEELYDAISIAEQNSRDKTAIIEEFINGTLHSHSAFIQDGKITDEFFVDEFCSVYPYQVDSSSMAVNLSNKVKNGMSTSIEKLISLLNLSDGLMHTQFIVDGDDFWLIETMRRCPGDLYGALIEKSTGSLYTELYVMPFLNKKVLKQESEKINKYIARHTVSVKNQYLFQSFSHTIPSEKIDIYPLKESGHILKVAPFDKVGILFAEFKDIDELAKYTPLLNTFINIDKKED
ncbi:ATP-grasp domain-containing protein [Sulfurimonas sp.]|nr:ATP-grasp domain-containing protein [Sulfurimonas sp.]